MNPGDLVTFRVVDYVWLCDRPDTSRSIPHDQVMIVVEVTTVLSRTLVLFLLPDGRLGERHYAPSDQLDTFLRVVC